MVLKKDPRALLDLLHKPVDIDEDEFLDKIDKNVGYFRVTHVKSALVLKRCHSQHFTIARC